MITNAGMSFIQRATLAVSIVSLTTLLGACSHTALSDSGEPKSSVVENVSSKSTAQLYADLIASAVFERTGSQIINGYTVESGKLRMPDKSEGALVTVRSADGSLLAYINSPEKSGSLHVDSKGVSRFISEPVVDGKFEDAIPDPNEKVATAPVDPNNATPYVIDILMGYSRKGVERAGGDANADALAKVEFVNLALRSSLVTNVSFKLVGIQVVEPDYEVSYENLGKLTTIFSEGIAQYQPDVIYGNFGTLGPGFPGSGTGYMPGRLAIGAASAISTFAHELGHNAGSNHCNENGTSNYRFGYDNGKSSSMMCGWKTRIYYSTPALKDEFGLPRGNAVTADTARVWRENAVRLSSYAPPQSPPSAPENFAKVGSTADTITFKWDVSPKAVRYEIYFLNAWYPVPRKIGDSTALTFTVTNVSGLATYFVKAVSFVGMVSPPSTLVVTKP